MDIKQIQDLIKLVSKTNIGELSIEEKDFKISIKKHEGDQQSVYTAPPVAQIIPQIPVVTTAVPPAPASPSASPEENKVAQTPKKDNLIAIKSPMVGTFYRQAGPDKPIFASVGDVIEKGQVVCIIEAMKLFNEIESEISGKIVQVLVEDASPVEYDQPLFLVEP